jgi:hypothetical protein
MCEFCAQHGEGKKWCLTMENYSKDLLDQKNRRKYSAEFLNGFHARAPKSMGQLDKIRNLRSLRDFGGFLEGYNKATVLFDHGKGI